MDHFGPWMVGGGRGLLPGVMRVRRGQELEPGQRVPKGLIRRVWREFARRHRRRLVLLLVAIAGGSALLPVTPILFGRIIDTVAAEPRPADALARVNLLAAVAVGVAVAAALFSLWQRYLSAWIGEELIYDLRAALYDHTQRMPLSFFLRTQTGALISRLNNDVIGAQRALTGTFGTLTANVIQVVATVGAMFAINWRLAVLALSVLPLFVVVAKLVARRLRDLTRASMILDADMNIVMSERFNVAGALLVKLFGRPDEETRHFADRARAVADIGVQSAIVSRLFFVILALVGSLGTAIVYWLGARAVLRGEFRPGDVVAFAALVTQAYQPLAALTNAPVEVLTALVSFQRVFEILDLRHPLADAPDAVALGHPRGEIEFDDVHFAYPSGAETSLASLERGFAEILDARPGQPVLRGVSFRAAPGSTVALVGPSGAGKTTITSLVTRLYDVTAGAVRIDGHDVRSLTLASLSAAIGVVPQDPHLFHDTLLANLRYARPGATRQEIEDACRLAQIHDVIETLPDAYETVVGERGYRLSGGEKQRIAIARVLLKNPAIVVLDEATAHLDSESEAAVQRALRAALAGRTSLVIAHRLSTILGADQILVVAGGRIVQRGTHEELVSAEGLYADLYRTQFARTG